MNGPRRSTLTAGDVLHVRTGAPWRVALGVLIVAGGLLTLGVDLWAMLGQQAPRAQQAALAGLIAAGATALGTLPVWLSQTTSERTRDAMMGFGAGVMLAASAFSLVVPALAAAGQQGLGPWPAGLLVGSAILVGALCLVLLDRWLPHEHFIKGPEGAQGALSQRLKRVWLFVFAVALHNMPEGLAIGVAWGGGDAAAASALGTGIAIQDVPEGLVIAVALRGAGYGRVMSAGIGALSGLVEPVAAVAAALVVGWSLILLPWGLAFAAGAMLYVISHEVIPESHRQGHERLATAGLMVGFVVMMLLDTALAG